MSRREQLFNTVMERSESGDIFFRPILMQFAAHHIGKTYREFYLDHAVLVEANIACMNDFGMDAVGLISDPYRETSAFGAVLTYPDEAVPHPQGAVVTTRDDIAALPTPDVYSAERTRDRIEGARLFRKRLTYDVPIIGWIEGPLAEACDLVGVGEMLSQLAIEPEFAKEILQKVVPTAKDFALAQIEAGADIIGMGDAICSQISPKMYAEYVKPLHDELIRFIQGHDAMVKVHICGNITHLLPHLAELKPDIVDIDWMVDMERSYQVLGPAIIRTGNLDPANVIATQTADEVFAAARALVKVERGRPFILSGGCEITPFTPAENLKAMKAAAQLNG
jgi:MtaA/CmuA family methyltransferase